MKTLNEAMKKLQGNKNFLKEDVNSNNSKVVKVNVYQIKSVDNCKYIFMGYDYAIKNGLNIKDYEKVATVDVEESDNIISTLDQVFTYGNTNKEFYEKNPKARSISMSDILEYNGDKYYVDAIGFKKIEKSLIENDSKDLAGEWELKESIDRPETGKLVLMFNDNSRKEINEEELPTQDLSNVYGILDCCNLIMDKDDYIRLSKENPDASYNELVRINLNESKNEKEDKCIICGSTNLDGCYLIKGKYVCDNCGKTKTSKEIFDKVDELEENWELDEDLELNDPEVNNDSVSIKVNGKSYSYKSDELSAEDLLAKYKAICKYSQGKAYAWLKKHSNLVTESKETKFNIGDIVNYRGQEWKVTEIRPAHYYTGNTAAEDNDETLNDFIEFSPTRYKLENDNDWCWAEEDNISYDFVVDVDLDKVNNYRKEHPICEYCGKELTPEEIKASHINSVGNGVCFDCKYADELDEGKSLKNEELDNDKLQNYIDDFWDFVDGNNLKVGSSDTEKMFFHELAYREGKDKEKEARRYLRDYLDNNFYVDEDEDEDDWELDENKNLSEKNESKIEPFYTCMECGDEFEKSQLYHTDPWGNPFCPRCGSGDVAVTYCDEDGNEVPDYEDKINKDLTEKLDLYDETNESKLTEEFEDLDEYFVLNVFDSTGEPMFKVTVKARNDIQAEEAVKEELKKHGDSDFKLEIDWDATDAKNRESLSENWTLVEDTNSSDFFKTEGLKIAKKLWEENGKKNTICELVSDEVASKAQENGISCESVYAMVIKNGGVESNSHKVIKLEDKTIDYCLMQFYGDESVIDYFELAKNQEDLFALSNETKKPIVIDELKNIPPFMAINASEEYNVLIEMISRTSR